MLLSKPIKYTVVCIFVCMLIAPARSGEMLDQDNGNAADFFKDPSAETDLIDALFALHEKHTKKRKPFALAGEAGVLIATGNTDTSMIKLALEGRHDTPNWSNNYASQFMQRTNSFQDADSIETTRIEISGQFDYKLSDPNHRLFAYVEYDDNQFNRLRDQATAVVGWSQVLWKEKHSEFRYSIGPGYSSLVQERTNTKLQEMIIRGTVFFDYKFSKFSQFKQMLSAELGQELTKARAQSSISARVFGDLAMKLSFELVLNDNVSNEDSRVSTQTSVSMVYQFF